MSQCLRCSKPREAASVFCESCRSLLRSQLGQSADIVEEETLKLSPVIAVPPEHVEVSDDPLERITGPQPAVPQSQPERLDTPPPEAPIAPEEYGNEYVVEYTVKSLSEAARRIAEIEQGNRRMLHASRLSPIRDISADIQRNSTPLPQISKKSSAEQEKDLGKHIPDHWPWLQPDGDSDESEDDTWSNRTDPLMARHFPNSAEIARIEEDDWRRAAPDDEANSYFGEHLTRSGGRRGSAGRSPRSEDHRRRGTRCVRAGASRSSAIAEAGKRGAGAAHRQRVH